MLAKTKRMGDEREGRRWGGRRLWSSVASEETRDGRGGEVRSPAATVAGGHRGRREGEEIEGVPGRGAPPSMSAPLRGRRWRRLGRGSSVGRRGGGGEKGGVPPLPSCPSLKDSGEATIRETLKGFPYFAEEGGAAWAGQGAAHRGEDLFLNKSSLCVGF